MAQFKPYKILSNQLASLPMVEGQFILTIDTNKLYFDKDNVTRIELYNGMQTSEQVAELIANATKDIPVIQYKQIADISGDNGTGGWINISSLVALQGIAFGKDKFVTCNGMDAPLYSTDGKTWQASSFLGYLNYEVSKVVFANKFFAFSTQEYGNPELLCSEDGLVWNNAYGFQSGTMGDGDNIKDVAYGNGKYLALTSNWGTAGLYSSTDGIEWNYDYNFSLSGMPGGIVFINDKFYIYAGDYYSSTDGETWTPVNGLNTLNLAYANGIIVAGDGAYSTDNGLTWNSSSLDFNGDIVYTGSKFVIAGIQKSAYSTDGINWTSWYAVPNLNSLDSLAYNPNSNTYIIAEDYGGGAYFIDSTIEEGEVGIIYLVPSKGENFNEYDEYIWFNNKYEKIGGAKAPEMIVSKTQPEMGVGDCWFVVTE